MVDLCCTFNVHIINGHLYDDTDSNYTCTANDGTSVVYYNIASSDLFPHVSYFNVENRDESVHFPLHCQLKVRSCIADNQAPLDLPETPRSKLRIRWKEDRKDIFLLSFREKLANVSTKLTQNIHNNINEPIKIIIGLYTSASATMTKRFTPSKPNDQPSWWDRACQELKQRKYSLLRKFRLSNLNADFRLYKQTRKEFKQKFKQNKQLYQKSRREELVRAWKDPHKFWRIVKGTHQSADSSKIKRSEWHEYFRALLYCENAADIGSIDDTEFEAAASANTLNEEISLSEVLSSIKQLKPGKSSGPDCIGANFTLTHPPKLRLY